MLLVSLQDNGEAVLDGPEGDGLSVRLTEEDVSQALLMPRGNINVTSKNTPEEINEMFLLLGGSDYTFKDLVQREMEVPPRFYT